VALEDLKSSHVMVVSDPLLLPSTNLPLRLLAVLDNAPEAFAALPVSNEAECPEQRRPPPSAYLTVRDLQAIFGELERRPLDLSWLTWGNSDSGIFVCRATSLRGACESLLARRVLEGQRVLVSATDYVHRWALMRGGMRHDLLQRIPNTARSVLEFGCGEGVLGHAIKQRQDCRVVGVEIDPDAAKVARDRIDHVHLGDVEEIILRIEDRFDWIVGGDIVEHLIDPWTFLGNLRRVCVPGARLLLTLPNVAHAALLSALLHGRFDYAYMGLTCAGHTRFFTRQSILEMLTIAGWTLVELAPLEGPITPATRELVGVLDGAGVSYSREDIIPVGFTVIASC
jgi:SAM-dependent methyltransferase